MSGSKNEIRLSSTVVHPGVCNIAKIAQFLLLIGLPM